MTSPPPDDAERLAPNLPPDTAGQQLRAALDFCSECLDRRQFAAAYQALCRVLTLAPGWPDLLRCHGHLALMLDDRETAKQDFLAAGRARLGHSPAVPQSTELPEEQSATAGDQAPAKPIPNTSPEDRAVARMMTRLQATWGEIWPEVKQWADEVANPAAAAPPSPAAPQPGAGERKRGAAQRGGWVVGLILATRFDTGYPHHFPPLGLGYLAASVQRELPEVRVVMAERLEDLLAAEPDLVGISAQTECYGVAVQMARRIKSTHSIPVVIGGVHITMLPESLDETFDVAVLGEGEVTFVELLRSFADQQGLRREALQRIPGLFFRNGDRFYQTAPREPATDLDALPPPAIETLPYYRPGQMVCLLTARGCPYHCTFCVSEKFAQRYRRHSPERVAADVEAWVKGKGVRHVVFYDDLFASSPERIRELMARFREKGLLGRCTFSCAVRANLVDENLVRLLRQLGVTDLGLGVESFSDRMLKVYHKTGCTGAINQRAIDLLHAAGIKVNPSLIFAAPHETREDMLVTLRQVYHNLREGKIHGPTWSTLIPYPGTRVWDDSLRRGIVGAHMDWEAYRCPGTALYLGEEVAPDAFRELMDEWQTKFSLLLRDHPSAGGTFVIRDPLRVAALAAHFHSTILNRQQREPGDELILECNRPPAPAPGQSAH